MEKKETVAEIIFWIGFALEIANIVREFFIKYNFENFNEAKKDK